MDKDFFSGIRIDFISFRRNIVELEGCLDYGVLQEGERLFFSGVNGNKVAPEWVERKQREYVVGNGETYNGGAFKVAIPYSGQTDKISAVVEADKNSKILPIFPGDFTRLSEIWGSYAVYGNTICRLTKKTINLHSYKRSTRVWHELRFIVGMLFYWRLRNARAALVGALKDKAPPKTKVFNLIKPVLIIAESIVMIPRAYILRIFYYVDTRRKRRPIWLISDRGMAAGDNGEALFGYINSVTNCPADVYFVISSKSKDYSRLREVGPVLDQDSFKYKRLFLIADKIISSQADVEVTNPFIRQKNHYLDLFTFDFIFLQHGIIRHDLSDWLNRFNKNISLFVTSAQAEYESILKGAYYYSKKNVLLSGLPRYDLLESAPKNKIILAPTYRKELARLNTNKNGVRPYDTEFRKSDYRKFYHDLMNDDRLIEAMKKYGMTGELYLHPVFSSQVSDFNSNDIFKIKDFPYDYRTAFKEGSLLVSDYSSVVFDFAYLKKPVIYTQFDKKNFFSQHMYQESTFFTDEKNGFGPVAYDYVTTVNTIIGLLEKGCVMEDKYKERVDEFFYKSENKSNSQLVYEAIVSS